MVLSAINQYMDTAFAGMVAGVADGRDVGSYINNQAFVDGIYDLVFTAVNSAVYTADIYGYHVTYTADGSATAAEIRDGIQAAIALQPGLTARVSAVDSGSNLRITELDAETYGYSNISGLDANTALTTVTAHGEEETIPAGVLVCRGTNYQDARLLHSASDPLIGIVMHQHAFPSDFRTSDRAGNSPNSQLSVLKRGSIWMVAEEAVALDDTPFFRYASLGANVGRGTVRNDADTSTCRSGAAFAKFMTAQATAGGLVLVKFNLVP